MKQPYFWKSRSFINYLLLPFSLIFIIAVHIRKQFTASYKPLIPVICIGNATAGGAGKTPTAIAIAEFLKEKEYKIAFLSKGYGGTLYGPVIVDEKKHNATECGDEPLLLSKIAPVIIAKDRKSGIKLAETFDIDFIIMDDGLQNPYIKKDINILVIDGESAFGNGMLIPAGPMRETLNSALKKANAAILIGNDKMAISHKLTQVPLIKADIIAKANVQEGGYLAFAGLAFPDKFFSTLKKCGYLVIKQIGFPDHYQYSISDIHKIKKLAESMSCRVITTEKDFVRLNDVQQKNIETLPITLNIHDKEILAEILKPILKNE